MAAKKNNEQVKKTTAGSSNSKSKKVKSPKVKTEYEPSLTSHIIICCITFILFVLFLVISINPEGAILQFIQALILGLLGQAGFYFAIPALLYLFIIQTFSKKTNVNLRSFCLVSFVLCCGMIYHLIVQTEELSEGIAVIPDLFNGGKAGTTGGVLCGGIAMFLRWSCGSVIAYLIVCVLAALSLLGAMQITIPSIFRAIANRPKDDWENEEQREYVEPATAVVNHIANKQIEKKRQMRRLAQERAEQERIFEEDKMGAAQKKKQIPGQQVIHETVAPIQESMRPQPVAQDILQPFPPVHSTGTPSKASAVMSTIDLDINAPISAARVRTSVPPAVPVTAVADEEAFEEVKSTPAPAKDPEIPSFVKQKENSVHVPQKSIPEKNTTEKPAKISAKDTEECARQVAEEIAVKQTSEKTDYCFPPIDLLKRPVNFSTDGTDEMRENSRRLNETLASFRIDAHIINVTRGPSVTRYEVELDKGVRLSKLTSCADDIALSLGASGVRIAAVPGKISIVGIEVPNRAVTTVSLREVIDSPEFNKAKSKSSFSVGKDISGACIVGNIAKMPHMLIAGTTGSGKSVCMNSIIISLLYKASPADVKLIMVDPKMVELGIYNGIPHLLIPVVTDPKKAAGSLQWAVTEMLRRYKLMSDAGVRDLESYNSIAATEENGQKLPQVVIIIDELADLMLVAAKEVEDSICRIAQMGRASGMHLIIATQRPSADVITGLMKANIPSRIAFSVASAMESRIILDTQGAEKLVGKGDMLYAPIGCGKPMRVQGCFVTDGEVEAVAGYVKDNYVANYDQQVLEDIEKKALQTGKPKAASDPEPTDEELDGDEMLPAAVDVILETGQASVSMLQRRLKLGYARAARIVDEMEEKGIVGPFQGSKPRSILITKEQWAAMRGGSHDDGDSVPDSDVLE